jgi:hypothetical protein
MAGALPLGALIASDSLGEGESDAVSRSVRGLAYGAPVADDPDAHTLDLDLPAATGAKPPLLVFVPGHFWATRAGGRSLDPHFARVLQGEGAAVALVRHRLAPTYRHPAGAEDVAAAVAFLVARAGPLRASDAAFVGGFGLALEAYPPETWRPYIFEQQRVAAEVGTTPVALEGPLAQRLYDLVVRERETRARPSGGE